MIEVNERYFLTYTRCIVYMCLLHVFNLWLLIRQIKQDFNLKKIVALYIIPNFTLGP